MFNLKILGMKDGNVYLMTHSTHFIYGYMASDILFPISSKGLYAQSHRQDSIYHGLCYTSRGALAGTRNIKNIKKNNNIPPKSQDGDFLTGININVFTAS